MSGRRMNDLAAAGFGGMGALYERVRPDYPAEAVAMLVAELGIARRTVVVDVGAGTGKLTRSLTPTGATVIAVEPLADMRARLIETAPRAVPFDGTAEAMALRTGSADAIVCAQAFHWFDGARALDEFHRVLRPGGGVGLIWNVRDTRVPWVARLEEIIASVEPDRPDHQTRKWRAAWDATALFTPLEQRTMPSAQQLSPEGLVDCVASVSWVAVLPDPLRESVFAHVRELISKHPDTRGREEIELPYRTEVYLSRRR
ncbi:MAG: class I SAM-dependent methyltransferase [Candidatus Limnocylindria bacterium]